MKLERKQFDILQKPNNSGGVGGAGKSPKGVQQYDPKGEKDDNKDTNGDSKGDSKDKSDSKEGKGEGKGTGNTVEIKKIPSGVGGILTEEQSAQMQKDLGVPYEGDGMSEEQIKEKINKALVEGTIPDNPNRGSSSQGSGSGGLRAALAKIARPQVDWKKALKKFIGRSSYDREETLGHRNFIHNDEYMWTEKDKDQGRMRDAVCAVDVSGSMSDDNIAIILTEIKGMVEAKKVKNTTIVYFHSDVEKITKLTSPGAVKKYEGEKVGSGGTDFTPPLEVMQNEWKKNRLELALFLTDGYANLNLPKPKFVNKFIWVILDNPAFVAPWGKMVVYVNSNKGKI